jgi:hypothetical protein
MSKVKIKYDERLGRVEFWCKGESSPRLVQESDEFAHTLEQIFDFVEQNSPVVKAKSSGMWKRAFGKSVRQEAWQWLRVSVSDKIKNSLRIKQ